MCVCVCGWSLLVKEGGAVGAIGACVQEDGGRVGTEGREGGREGGGGGPTLERCAVGLLGEQVVAHRA